jgi:enoyl-[acyl-carrier protein] reductase III
MDLRGKYALVTGASRGIGRAIALKLAEEGVNVAINYLRSQTTAIETAKEIEKRGARALLIRGNVAERGHIDCIFEKIATDFGRLDFLVSNAASGVLKPALELTDRHWHWTMDINAGALLALAQKAVPLMGERGGRIVAVSSLGAVRAIPDYAAVGASKAALESLVRHLAVELAPRRVNVNAVSAGVVETDALKHFPNRDLILENSRQRTPAGRLTTPEDVARVVYFLCTSLADMIHGQTLVVDGGYSIVA